MRARRCVVTPAGARNHPLADGPRAAHAHCVQGRGSSRNKTNRERSGSGSVVGGARRSSVRVTGRYRPSGAGPREPFIHCWRI
ncbi:hypothetical protein NDU88_008447 [Pleurodeles waltl]|uniref:Uncharacterized protein n=1 Tax=Pleurodeles waltl TaxID=8319 RepID=A0AAV7N8Y1_PLEWA|nr:hypothetical protein NDU88_008447 [Pleurodeles waltl]